MDILGASRGLELQELLEIVREGLKPSLKKYLHGVLIYGPIARGAYIPAWSDLDLIIFPEHNFVCPFGFYSQLGSWYTNIREKLEERGVNWGVEEEVNFSVYDVGNMRDGRYAGMTKNFIEQLRKDSKVFWPEGKDVRKILPEKYPTTDEEYSIGYGLLKCRTTASTLDYYKKHDKKQFKYDAKKSIKALGSFLKNAATIKSRELREESTKGIAEQYTELFPNVNYEHIQEIFKVPGRWTKLSEDEDEITKIFFNGLRIREEIVKTLVESE